MTTPLERLAGFLRSMMAGSPAAESGLDEAAWRALENLKRFADLGHMTAALAHDLRTPLHVAASSAESLGAGGAAGPADREELALLRRSLAHLEKRLGLVVEYARSGRGRRSPARLEDLLRAALELMGNRLKRQGVKTTFRLKRTPKLAVETARIEGVLYNLLANAADAMPEGGRLVLSSGSSRREIWVSVADDGPGLAAGALRGQETPLHSSKPEGAGLGLYLSRRALQEHGASLVLSSRPGRGASAKVIFQRGQ